MTKRLHLFVFGAFGWVMFAVFSTLIAGLPLNVGGALWCVASMFLAAMLLHEVDE